jgi:transcriptional regulator with XRE-family HTH domain
MEIPPTIGQRIAYARKQRIWTVKDLSDKTGFTEASIVAIEADELDPPSNLVLMFAESLGASLDFLLHGKTEPPNADLKSLPTRKNRDASGKYKRFTGRDEQRYGEYGVWIEKYPGELTKGSRVSVTTASGKVALEKLDALIWSKPDGTLQLWSIQNGE